MKEEEKELNNNYYDNEDFETITPPYYRVMYVDGKNINNSIRTILDMHTRNNL